MIFNLNKFFGPQEVVVLLEGTLTGPRERRERYGYESANVIYDVEVTPDGALLYRANGHNFAAPNHIHRAICTRFGLEERADVAELEAAVDALDAELIRQGLLPADWQKE